MLNGWLQPVAVDGGLPSELGVGTGSKQPIEKFGQVLDVIVQPD
jgi:hypothetical protein